MKVVEVTFEDFLDLRKIWNDVLYRSIDNNFFLTWEWLYSWWRTFGEERGFHLIAIVDNKKYLAAAPLMSSDYYLGRLKLTKLEFIASQMSDYNTFLLTEKKFEHVRMLIKFATERISNWDSIEFSEVPENSNTAELLAMLKTKPSFTARIRNICPYIPLPNQLEDYLIKLDGRFRRELRRCEKNLGRGNKVSFRTCNKMTDVESDMRTFFDLHEKRWNSRKMPGALPSKKLHDFHQNVAQLLAEKGWLNLSFTMVNDLPVASVYGFTYGQKLYAYLSGFDPSYAQYSVADLHWRYLVEHCIKSNLLELDFMRGAESYKKKWNTKARRNLEFWTAKKRVVPIFYNLITKNDNFASIRARIGPRLVKYFS